MAARQKSSGSAWSAAASWAGPIRTRSARSTNSSTSNISPSSRRFALATRAAREAFAENWGYTSFETDWRKLVAREDIDLIDIASPNDTHAEIAIAAAAAGKMVMCEKPLGRNAAEVGEDGRGRRIGQDVRTWSGTIIAAFPR